MEDGNASELADISIHSTARVETFLFVLVIPSVCNFNPLHREGGDPSPEDDDGVEVVFQSTPPRGWRPPWICQRRRCWDFNPLHREGGDSFWCSPISLLYHFNPLHREGGDQPCADYGCKLIISIHSTARVETQIGELFQSYAVDFNPLHREGGDPIV